MANLVNLTIQAPGFFGLNKQGSGEVLPPGWATKALNLVIDDVGRLAKRKGTKEQGSAVIGGSPTIGRTHVYVDNLGNSLTIVAAGNAIYKLVSGTWTDISGTITTPTADYWTFQNFNGKCVGWQEGHDPIVLSAVGGTFADIVSGGATAAPQGRHALAAFGRIWVIDEDTLHFCDVLDETNWDTGTAGTLTLTRTWPGGTDEPIALAEFNGNLVIFGARSIVIYGGTEDPASAFSAFTRTESIDGVGCLHRNTVQNIGRDLIWMSAKGIRTLGRVIQEKSMPVTDAAPHVRDYLLAQADLINVDTVQSAYVPSKGLYVICFPLTTLAFDLRMPLENATLRVTEWGQGTFSAPTNDGNGDLLMSTGSNLVKYEGELDNVLSDGTGGDNIPIDFEGVWNDFGEEVGPMNKSLKKLKLYVFGGAGETVSFKWTVDYRSSFTAINIDIPVGQTIARWGVAKYSVDHYSGTFSFNELAGNASRTGRVVKVGLSGTLGSQPFAMHRIDMFAKIGKLST